MKDQREATSHVEALKSTSIMGGSSAIVILIRMARTKVLAILLGPAGVGLEAIYDSIISLAQIVTDMGISFSGVRQIASAVGSGSQATIAATVFVLRRVCLVLGIVGAAALFLMREQVSRLTFGNADHAFDIGLLSVILLLSALERGQSALIRGLRRTTDLAKIHMVGTTLAVSVCIPIAYIWGLQGIPAYMVLMTAVGTLISWSYARRIQIEAVKVPPRQVATEAASLLKLGLAFVSTGLMSTGALFLLRALVTRQDGIDGVGQFQAANAISMMYATFVLQPMGIDFYPRLTAVADDNARCNTLVNEQAEITILLALPAVLATMAFAPWAIQLFYSAKFQIAGEIASWQIAGMFLRTLSWPIGFIVLAKGRAAVLFWTEFAAYSVYVALGWFGLGLFGLPGTGMAFLGLNIFHLCMIFAVMRRISGFSWSSANRRLSLLGISTAGITLWIRLKLPEPWATIIGCSLAIVTGLYCLRTLVVLVGVDEINKYTRKIGFSFPLRKVSEIHKAPLITSKE